MSLQDRLMSKVEMVPESGCWIWTGTNDGDVNGYGQTWDGSRRVRAHRAMWALVNGAIPDGLLVCHKCDTKSCINPDHLFLGSTKDNVRDRDDKGRQKAIFGERHYRAKLTMSQAQEIRQSGSSLEDVAKKFGITKGQAAKIRRGASWKKAFIRAERNG